MRYNHFTMLPERAFQRIGGRMTYEGGGDSPPPPDYVGAARQTGESSKEAITQQTFANRPNMSTPWGNMTWNPAAAIDPSTGQPVTTWQGNLNLSPQEQAALNAQQNIQAGRSQAAQTLLGQATGAFQQPADWNALPGMAAYGNVGYNPNFSEGSDATRNRAEQALFQRQMGMIEPGLSQSEAARRTRLANMGIAPEGGSEAWNRAQAGMDTARQKAYSDAALNAIAGGGQEASRQQAMEAQRLGMATQATQQMNQLRQQAIAEMAQRRGMSLNELNALLTGQQVAQPQMPTFTPATGAAPTNYLGAAGMQGQQQQAGGQSAGSGIGTLIGTAAGAYFGGPMGAAAGGAAGGAIGSYF